METHWPHLWKAVFFHEDENVREQFTQVLKNATAEHGLYLKL
jgi:hypothetical protein